MCLDEVGQLLQQEQRVGLCSVASGSLYHLVVTLGLLGEDLEQALCLGLHLGVDGIGLTFGIDALLFSLGLSSDDETLLLNLLSHDDVCLLAGTLAVGTGILGLLLGSVSLLQSLCIGHLLGSHSLSLGFGLSLTAHGIGVGNGYLGFVLTLHGFCIRLGSTDTRLADSFSLTDFTVPLLFGNANLGFVDGLGSSFLAESLDVAALVLDVGHVDVDEPQADLLQLDLDVGRDGLKELVAVGIQFFDAHGSDDETKLTEEDVAGKLLNLLRRLSQQALCCCQHTLGLGADADSEAARHIDADVLAGQSIRQVCINADGRQREISIVLDDRPYESTTAMHTLGTLAVAAIAIDNQYLVTRAATIAVDDGHEKEDEYDDSNHDKKERFHNLIYYLTFLILFSF